MVNTDMKNYKCIWSYDLDKNGLCAAGIVECVENCPMKKEHGQTTNADRIRMMSDEELAKFVCSISLYGHEPWSNTFEEMVCNSCRAIFEQTSEKWGKYEVKACECTGHSCPHNGECGPNDIAWWLMQPTEENT